MEPGKSLLCHPRFLMYRWRVFAKTVIVASPHVLTDDGNITKPWRLLPVDHSLQLHLRGTTSMGYSDTSTAFNPRCWHADPVAYRIQRESRKIDREVRLDITACHKQSSKNIPQVKHAVWLSMKE